MALPQTHVLFVSSHMSFLMRFLCVSSSTEAASGESGSSISTRMTGMLCHTPQVCVYIQYTPPYRFHPLSLSYINQYTGQSSQRTYYTYQYNNMYIHTYSIYSFTWTFIYSPSDFRYVLAPRATPASDVLSARSLQEQSPGLNMGNDAPRLSSPGSLLC